MNENKKFKTQVLIVGAGPTGLTLAYALAQLGISIRIIDKSQEPSQHSKALAIQARTLETLKILGLEKSFLEKGIQARHLNAYLEKCRLWRFHIHNSNTPFPFILILPQNDTENILITRLREDFHIEVERSVDLIELKQQARTVRVELLKNGSLSEKSTYDYVCGCDGAHSHVRGLLSLPFDGNIFEESFTLLDCHIKGDLPLNEGNVFLGHEDLMGIIPISKKYHRIILAQPPNLRPPETLLEFQTLLNKHSPKPLELSDEIWMSHFRVSRRIVPTMNLENVFLLGDAAHIHSPAGGQGMNLGIQDAINLAWKLSLVLQNHAPTHFLESFSRERRPIAQHVLRGTNFATRELITQNRFLLWLRNHLLANLLTINWIQEKFADAIMQLSHNYRKSNWVSGDSGHKLKPGDRFPHFWIEDSQDQKISSLNLVNPHSHTLVLALNRTLTMGEKEVLQKIKGHHNIKTCVISSLPSTHESYYKTTSHELKNHLYVSECALFLIRPDGYIGMRSSTLNEELISNYFQFQG
ncbi:FAD-dependent monooxygenase [Candidatus Bealeia paramacronuclearis]|uniref:FAD-dependent monooxygenase n=1 Tax=Candidatus Bealeia paramacronuclearis TaxID=1921001 RepID=A0ABZ2C521_9PROT|nr:FAD-dependent monooxygenase [Candidatus Bealeia paramacronuclearis]